MAEHSLRDHQQEASAAAASFTDELERRRLVREGWSEECLASEQKFGHRVARLYPLLNAENGVRTPEGIGTLMTAFSTGCQVLLMKTRAVKKDLGGKPYHPMHTFNVEEIEPYRRGR